MIAQLLLPSSSEQFLRAPNQELGPIAWQSGPGNGKRGNTRPVTRLDSVTQYLFGAVAQTALSAGSGDFPVPSAIRETALECTANPPAGKPALMAADALNGYEPAGWRVSLVSKNS